MCTPELIDTLHLMVADPAFIAIVDDEESVARAIERLLRSVGFTARAFHSGTAFCKSLATSRPRCVVLDLHMPGMSGMDVQDQIAGMKPAIPIIAITGHDAPDVMERVMNAGAKAYLRKPVDGEALLNAIAKALGVSGTESPRRSR